MCNFRVGQKVVCVDAEWSNDDDDKEASPLVKGAIYTVNAITNGAGWLPRRGAVKGAVLSLSEVENPNNYLGFYHSRFLPVVERGTETGMSILRDILNKTDKPARVEA